MGKEHQEGDSAHKGSYTFLEGGVEWTWRKGHIVHESKGPMWFAWSLEVLRGMVLRGWRRGMPTEVPPHQTNECINKISGYWGNLLSRHCGGPLKKDLCILTSLNWPSCQLTT